MNKRADDLLASARDILTSRATTFIVQPWRTLMTKAKAKETAKALKAAAAKSTTPAYKHTPTVSGVDSDAPDVVQSNSGHNPMAGLVNQLTKDPTMTKQEQDAAKAQEKIAAKEAKQKAAAEAKAAKEAERAAAKEAREAAAAAKKAEKEAAKAERKPRERTYEGSMLTLAERVKAGAYVKGANGQLRSTDPIAEALDAVPAPKVVDLLIDVLGLPSNPYTHLNYGQQSMNLRNRLRGAVRRGLKVEGTDDVITLDRLTAKVSEALADQPSA